MRAAPPIERHAVGRARRGSRRRLPGRPRGTVDPDPSTRRDASLRSLHRAPSPRRSTARSHGTRSAPAHARASARYAADPGSCEPARHAVRPRCAARAARDLARASDHRSSHRNPAGRHRGSAAVPFLSAYPIPSACRSCAPDPTHSASRNACPIHSPAPASRRSAGFEIDPATWHVMLRRTGVGSADVTVRVVAATTPDQASPPKTTTSATPEGWRSSCDVIRRRPTLPGDLSPSTIGAERLNFRVRDGNGCDPLAMATGNLLSIGSHPKDSRASTSECRKIQALGRLVPVG